LEKKILSQYCSRSKEKRRKKRRKKRKKKREKKRLGKKKRRKQTMMMLNGGEVEGLVDEMTMRKPMETTRKPLL
jgi:hypothetical protein